jgi:dihydrofolate reductase
MRSVIYSMSVSLDGYIAGPDGSFDWTTPDEEVFRFTDQTRELAAHVMGRRLYETMLYWETADQNPALDYDTLEWASVWEAPPEDRVLDNVVGRGRECPARLRQPGRGDRAVAG